MHLCAMGQAIATYSMTYFSKSNSASTLVLTVVGLQQVVDTVFPG